MGYGYAKQQLFECILDHFTRERELYDHFHKEPEEVYIALTKGAEKASNIANKVLLRVRDKLGF